MAHYNKKLFSVLMTTALMTTACNLRCKYCITTPMEREDNISIPNLFAQQ